MSFKIVSTTRFPQSPFPYVPARPAPLENAAENGMEDLPIIGGILPDLKHIWNAKGPCLEVRNITTGHKVGSWTFGKLLGDYGVSIAAVQELKRSRCNISLLVVALNSSASGGQICIFDTYGSKVLRVVQLGEQITSIYVVDHGCETSSLPETTPLKYFDGILAIGTVGATVYLMDLCKQISEDVIHNWDCNVRNELSPCSVVILKKEKQGDIRKYIEKCVDSHVALCLNESSDSKKEYFALKGEDGNQRVCVNRVEAEVSALLYSQQLGSLLIGYNFGSFQVWDLSSIGLCYTSPICEGNIPVTHFTVQEPADDPKSYCYVWVSYSHTLFLQSGLPYAVMYSFLYDTKSYLNGFGNVYENFQHCTLRFQIELGDTESSTLKSKVQGGLCLGIQSVTKRPLNKDLNSTALCLVSWLFWNAQGEANTAILLFDLNQWYKEQMPRVPNWLNCSSYMIRHSMKEIALDVKMDQKSLSQFMGVQRLEEHFFPTALSFDLWGVTENSVLKINNKGLQKAFLDRIAQDGHLALVKPDDFAEQVVSMGLVPLFCDVSLNNSTDLAYQREILLNVALEHRLLFWLCDSTTKLANGSFSAAGLNLFDVLNWAFQRAVYIKSCCDKYCVPLFDYSGMKLDDNTTTLIACGAGQIRTLCSFYRHVTEKLAVHVDQEALLEELKRLENVVVYFEVLLWMVNVGLLPEYPPSPNITLIATAPYLVQNLTEYYNKKRVQLQLACKETFVDKDCLLFIDNMINYRGCADVLRQQWQEDGGSGLYPPPSLQSVLRTYLLDGADLNFKHSLVTYILLDISMTLDENDKIIKLLLKFPQIFNLTLSKIKIVQAFWHLDHDDYEMATQTILDSCVLPLDLQHWHHSVMMRSLLMQDHSSLALLYLEVRKPTLQEKKDLLTVLSLLISKNMLDEAFKFRQQYEGPTEHFLLQHIFEECNKNGFLYTLLHRQMDAEEEKVFFKYLQRTGNSQCQDLQIFYYLQRARFLEAFDTYSSRKRKLPDSQGLIGHRDASAADNILIMFKNLLPDVNRDLVELVRKERQTLWKEVPRPTPLSVFVHNAGEKIRYKSSVIFAALSKAKQTFNDTLGDAKGGTEDTPFLRTPSLVRSKPRTDTPLMKSRVIQHNESGEIDEYCGPTPSKKLKLSARSFRMSMSESLSGSNVRSVLTTPIVKRKRLSTEQVDITTNWPHSILKSATKPLVEDTRFEESLMNNVTSDTRGCISRAAFELSPRKSMRTPLKGHVKFDIIRNSCSSSDEPSLRSSILSNISTGDSRRVSKNSSISIAEDDSVFYSPDVNVKTSPKKVEEERKKSLPKEKLEFNNDDEIPKDEPMPENPPKVQESSVSGNMRNFQSPRARRSYKRSFEESPIPVRSSPRLTRKTISEDKTSPEKQAQSLPEIPLSPSSDQRLRGRRSLARSVLEQNAFSALNEDQPSLLLPSNKSLFSSFSSANSSVDMDSTDSSWQELFDRCKQAEVEIGEKSREVSVITTRRESLRRRDTGALVTSKEIVEKLQSRTVEVIAADDDTEENKEDTAALQVDENEQKPENSPNNEEEFVQFDVYDDLSSGSEDVREVLQNLDKTNLGKTYADLTQSGSLCRQEDDEHRRSASEGSPGGLNEARMTSQDFIEIGSSSDEEAPSHRSSSTPRYEPESSDRNSQSYDSSSRGSENVQASEHSRLSSRIDEDEETQEGPFRQSRQHDEVDEDEDTTEFPAVSYCNHQKKQPENLDYDEDELVVHQDDGVPENIFEEASGGQIDEDEETQEVPRQHDEVLIVDDDEDTTEFRAVSSGMAQTNHLEVIDDEDELELHQDDEVPDNIFEDASRTTEAEGDTSHSTTRNSDLSIEDPLKVNPVETQSVSLQCTIAARNVDDESKEKHEISEEPLNCNSAEVETQSISLQCTIDANKSKDEDTTEFRAVSASIAQTNHLEIIDDEDKLELHQDDEVPQNIFEEASRTTETEGDSLHSTTRNSDLPVEDPLKVDPVETQSVSLQCTIAARNLDDKSREKHELSQQPLNCNSAEVETQSISLQCSIDANKSADIKEESNSAPPEQQSALEDSVFIRESAGNIFEEDDLMEGGEASPPDSPGVAAVGEDNGPIIEKTILMRSVKKTYKGRRTKSEMSEDVDATPKVAVDKIKHTYARSKTSFKQSENSTEAEKDDTQNKSDKTENSTNTNAEQKSPEATPIRMTRRRSRLYSQGSTSTEDTASQSISAGSKESDSATHRSLFDEMSFFETPEQKANEGEAKLKPLPIRLRRTSKGRVSESDTSQIGLEEPKAESSRISTRAPSKSKETTETSKAVAAVKPVRRTRSVSVDQPPPVKIAIGKKRSTRSKSVDIDDAMIHGQLKSTLPPIEEQPGTSRDSQASARPSSSIGDYSTSRRLTRNQASMLKTISQVEKEVKKLAEGHESDSVQAGLQRKKLRTRTQSVDSISVTSEQSDGSSPPKRSKESDHEGDDVRENKPRGKRARSASVSSVKSNTSVSSVRSTRSRRLAEIQEEIGSNEEESLSSSVKNRRGGKK